MDRDNRIVRLECADPVRPFRDRQTKQQGVGKEAAEPDRDTVFPVPPKDVACAQEANNKTCKCRGVIAAHQGQIKVLLQIKGRDRAKEQAGNGEALGEFHQPINASVAEISFPDCNIAEADHKEDRQNNVNQRSHFGPFVVTWAPTQ